MIALTKNHCRSGLALIISFGALLLSALSFILSPAASVSAVPTQEKGGVIKPASTPTSKPRSTPRRNPQRPSVISEPSATPISKPTPTPTSVTRNPNIELVRIPPGSFMMGSNTGEADEEPVHQVTINYSFFMGKYEVTQAQWQAVMGKNPSRYVGCNDCPVESVSWNDIQKFMEKLNQTNDRYVFRLPSEAEWEYACRSGTTTKFAFGDSLSSDQANFNRTQNHIRVGSFQPNAWGLYDMHGNVEELCQDWFHDSYYSAPSDGSAWLSGSEQKYRVMRGGSYDSFVAERVRSSRRNKLEPYMRGSFIGFRVVAVVRRR